MDHFCLGHLILSSDPTRLSLRAAAFAQGLVIVLGYSNVRFRPIADLLLANMQEEPGSMIMTPWRAGCLVALIAFAFYATCFNLSSHGWFAWRRLAQSGHTTVATVVKKTPENHQACYLDYLVNAHQYQVIESCELRVGQSVTLTYDPTNPNFATLRDPRGELLGEILVPAILSAIAGTLAAFRRARQLRRNIGI
jgi:hypothetical protein